MKFPLVLAVVLAAAFLVACSDDSDPAPAATSVATEAGAAAATATPAPATPAPTATATPAPVAASSSAEDSDDGDDHDHGHAVADAEAGRIIVTDAASPYASVIDLGADLVVQGAFEVAAPGARVYSGLDNRYAFVLARGPEDADDRIHVLDGGIYSVPHGDHEDLVTGPVVRRLDIAEELPIHYTDSGGWVAVFADSRGRIFLFDEDGLGGGDGYEPVVLDAGPHHGVAIAVEGDMFIVSTKHPDYPENSDDSLPVGVEVRDLADNVVYDDSNRSCPGLHGEAHGADGVLFGCIGGVLLLRQDGAAFSHRFFENPEVMRDDARVGTVYGHAEADTFFVTASWRGGDGWGQDGLWLVDSATGAFTRVMDESSTAAFGPEGERFFAFTADGVLHAFDSGTGELLRKAALIDPAERRPAMAFVGDDAVVTDPANGLVRRVSLDDFSLVDEWEVGGTPASLAFVGLGGDSH